MKNRYIWILLFILIAVGIVYLLNRDNTKAEISSFEECVKLGNPIMESDPRQCRTEAGDLFIESIDEEPIVESNIEIQGEIEAIDLSEMPVDGPARITISLSSRGTYEVQIPSGEARCEARGNMEDITTLEIGMTIEVRGEVSPSFGPIITPCSSEDHYLRIVE